VVQLFGGTSRITEQAKRLFPYCSVTSLQELPTGDKYTLRVSGLSNRDLDFGLLLMKVLGENGWETISASLDGDPFKGVEEFEFHLKLKVD